MSRLYLLRHAKAGWAKPGMKDFDRPLDETGIADARAAGATMHASGYVPDLTLCSTACRTRETLKEIAGSADTGRVIFLDTLYTDDASTYLDLILQNGSAGSLLVIGHNPMMEDLAMALSRNGEESALKLLRHGFPTSGLAVIRFDKDLGRAAPDRGYLEAFLLPLRR